MMSPKKTAYRSFRLVPIIYWKDENIEYFANEVNNLFSIIIALRNVLFNYTFSTSNLCNK